MLFRERQLMNPFKPGDWVKYKDQQDTTIYKVINILPNDLIDIEDTIVDKYDIELWQPQPGEWCWFLNHKNDLPRLRKFISASNPFDRPTVYTTQPDPSTEMSRAYCGIESYNYCEPFIGQLPTILKDK